MGKTALVTGATGFTGGYMVKNLLANGYQVKVMVRASGNTRELEKLPVNIVQAELHNPAQIEEAVKGSDIVFHIAAMYRAANEPDQVYRDVNVIGTQYIFDAALEHNVERVVYCSTVGVHGHVDHPPATEDAPLKPGDIYQHTKVEAEELAMQYYHKHQLPVTIVRPTGIYGPGDLRMLKMYRMVQKGRFLMLGSKDPYYHLTYVTDIVEGFRLAGENPASVGKAYIIAGKDYFTLRQYAETIAQVLYVDLKIIKLPLWPVYAAGFLCEKICIPLHVQPPIFRRRVDLYIKDRAFDCSRAKRELGYAPQVEHIDGIRRTAEWYIEQGYLNPINK